MKKQLVSTLSLTLLLSTPVALNANPYEQKNALTKEIEEIKQNIEGLKKQRDNIDPTISKLTLESSKKDDTAILIETGKKINDLNLLAAQTATLIKQNETTLKTKQAEVPALDARIKTLEPAATLIMFKEYQKNLDEIKKWTVFHFEDVKIIKVVSAEDLATIRETLKQDKTKKKEDKIKKIDFSTYVRTVKATVKQSDKSVPVLPTKEEYLKIVEERKNQPQGWLAWTSFIYAPKTTRSAATLVAIAKKAEDKK